MLHTNIQGLHVRFREPSGIWSAISIDTMTLIDPERQFAIAFESDHLDRITSKQIVDHLWERPPRSSGIAIPHYGATKPRYMVLVCEEGRLDDMVHVNARPLVDNPEDDLKSLCRIGSVSRNMAHIS